jgi:hypothetical protein
MLVNSSAVQAGEHKRAQLAAGGHPFIVAGLAKACATSHPFKHRTLFAYQLQRSMLHSGVEHHIS